ncbi:MAG: glycosyltransferase family 4 protein [Chloroflexota bacterium]|nr:glycosyltransferase family 4 protein [Chloroflexota bacterium]
MSEPPLRLAFLADPRSVHTRRWLEFFAERGHRVALMLADDRPEAALDSRIEVHRYRRFGPRRIPFFSSLQGRGALRRLLHELRPEILHAQYVSQYGWQARRSGFEPYVATAWGSDLLLDPGRSLRARFWAGQVLSHAALVTVPSEHLVGVARRLGAPEDRLHRIPFGVDTRAFVPSDDREALEQAGLGERPIVFSPRAIRPLYRQETVLYAVASLPRQVTLVMTGRNADPGYLAHLRATAAELGMGQRLRVIGDIGPELMTNLFQAADVVVSVPESDGLPISVLEAMACGVPVVSSDLPGPREALGDSAERLLVPVADATALAGAIDRVLGLSTEERRELGVALRQRAMQEFDFRTCMEQMERLYFSIRKAA